MNKIDKINWDEIIENKLDEIRDKVKEMITGASNGTTPYQQDLYIYPDGKLHIYPNRSGNSWLEDNHKVLWVCQGPSWWTNWETVEGSEGRAEEINAYVDTFMEYSIPDKAKELMDEQERRQREREEDEAAWAWVLANLQGGQS